MQGFIDSGEEYLQPLKEFRNWLKDIREEPERRSPLRRDGKSAGPGPFNPATRREILGELLALERKVGFQLISDEDITYIQQEWQKEFDYSNSAMSLARQYGREISLNELPVSREHLDDLLEACAVENGFPPELAYQLLEKVRDSYADLGRWGAKRELAEAIAELIKKDVRQAEKADPSNDI